MRGRSCVTQLLSVLHELGAALDAGLETDVIYLDFSKAFDSVPHKKLLHKLSLFGITGSLHRWFSDYLLSRSQRVLVDGAFSPWTRVESGVPQGSLLGPFLFLLYVNDLPDVVRPGSSIALFADDAKCSRPISNAADHRLLQLDLDQLYNWSLTWGLSFNIKKCEVLRISRKRFSPAPSLAVSPYILGGSALTVVSSQKDLGVTVSCTLKWGLHVSIVVANANRTLGFLRRHCTQLGTDRKRLLYFAFVRSKLGYASEVWAPQSCISADLRLCEAGAATRDSLYSILQ